MIKIKKDLSIDDIAYHDSMVAFVAYVFKLGFEDTPDYEFLRKSLIIQM